jgi:hypothetical protein
MKLNHFAQLAALSSARQIIESCVLDKALDAPEADDVRKEFALKRLQFDTSQELYSKVEAVCVLMTCSKREFLEMAVIDAIEKAWAVYEKTYEEAAGHPWDEYASYIDSKLNPETGLPFDQE